MLRRIPSRAVCALVAKVPTAFLNCESLEKAGFGRAIACGFVPVALLRGPSRSLRSRGGYFPLQTPGHTEYWSLNFGHAVSSSDAKITTDLFGSESMFRSNFCRENLDKVADLDPGATVVSDHSEMPAIYTRDGSLVD